jgi:lysozyme family protein
MARKVNLTSKLAREYERLWRTARYTNKNRNAAAKRVVKKILQNKSQYEAISERLGGNIPWQFIAVIHNRESSMNFSRHLHNGDSLKARTWRVPANRPRKGTPPFTFVESADDALRMKGLHRIKNWTVARTLYELERYNGFGYRLYRGIQSPYLWAGSNHYTRGKYVQDGKYSASTVDRQLGVCILLHLLGWKAEEQIAHEAHSDKDQGDGTPESYDPEKVLVDKSRKHSLLQRLRITLMGLLPVGWFSMENFKDLREIVQDNTGLILFGTGVLLYFIFNFLHTKGIEDFKEGRYVPSGLKKEEE